MTINKLKTALDTTGYKFAHYAWAKAPSGDYGVYAEDDQRSLWGNGHMAEHTTIGTIDYFTRDDTGTPKSTIESVLNGIDISWYLNSIQYENDTGYIHYEWVFEF